MEFLGENGLQDTDLKEKAFDEILTSDQNVLIKNGR